MEHTENTETKQLLLDLSLTEEESKELGWLLQCIISDYLDFTLIDVTSEVKQQAIRQANTYKMIYNKLIKPIYKVEE